MNYATHIELVQIIARELAARFDLPELATAQVNPTNAPHEPHAAEMGPVAIAPRGQFAAMMESATATLFVDDMHTPDLHRVRLRFNYQHHSGGGNGYTRDMVAVTLPELAGAGYMGIMDTGTSYAFKQALSAALKAKSTPPAQ